MSHEPDTEAATDEAVIDPIEQVIDLLDVNPAAGVALLAELRPADAAHVLEHLSDDDLAEVVPALDADVVSGAIEYADPGTRIKIVRYLDATTLTEALEAVPDDVAADVVGEMDQRVVADLLETLSEERREELEQLLTYPEDTAGGRMTGQVITLSPTLTAGQAIERLRDSQADASKPFYLYVTENDRTLLGVLNTRGLLTSAPSTPITALMTEDMITVPAEMDQEEAANLIRRHGLLALPVVDQHHHLLGTITVDDLLDVMQEEATEDLYRLALVHEDEDLRGVRASVRYRLPWLTVNLGTAMMAAVTVAFFEGTLERVAILAAFLPVIGGQGGNAGIQTLTVVIRSMALGRISVRDTGRLLWHELRVGFTLGLTIGLMVSLVALGWRGNPWLGAVVFVALSVNITVGALAGVVIPMVLQRLKQDPALGGIWLMAATDLSGFLAFLVTATLLIDRLE